MLHDYDFLELLNQSNVKKTFVKIVSQNFSGGGQKEISGVVIAGSVNLDASA